MALIVAWGLLGKHPPGKTVHWKTLLSFEWKTLLFAFFLNGLLQLDLQLMKGLAPLELGDTSFQAGIYGAMQQIATLPYVATIAVAFVVFPLVSRSTYEMDIHTARTTIQSANRFVLILLGAAVSAMALFPEALILLVYPADYLQGMNMLRWLSVAYLFFSFMVLNANVLTGSGHPAWPMMFFGAALVVSGVANVWLIPLLGGEGAARTALLAMGTGAVGIAWSTFRRFGAVVPLATLVRLILATLVVVGVRWLILPQPLEGGTGWHRLGPVGIMAAFFLLFLFVLFLAGEWPPEQRKKLVALWKRK